MLRSFMPAERDDVADFVRRAQQGCAESFEELIRRFQVPLLHFLRQRASPADAEDLLQETFIRAYENLHRYQPRWPFAAWLFTIARRLNANHFRRRRVPTADEDVLSLDELCGADPAPIERMVEEEDRRRLWDVAGRILTEEQFTALWLHYVEDMPVQELGLVLGRTTAAVKVILFRARKKLLPLLGEFNGREATQTATNQTRMRGVSKASQTKP